MKSPLKISSLVLGLMWSIPIFAQINEDYKLMASDGAMGDQYGHCVAVDNGIIAIGSPMDDDNGTNSGAAYLYDAFTGAELFKLLPNDGAPGAEFGYSISIDNGLVAVGARMDDQNGTAAGAAYLFSAIDGTQLVKLTPTDPEVGDEFGNAIDLDNGIVAVGAWRSDDYGDGSGAAYLFEASTGSQLQKLLPPSGNNYQTFGVSIAIDNDLVAIGARTFFVAGQGYTFAKAHLFEVATGDQLRELQPDILNLNGDLGGHFADALAMDNGLVAVGAWSRTVNWEESGSAYVFDAYSGEQLHWIAPDDIWDRDHCGISISMDNQIVAIGSEGDDDNAWSAGAAYLYNADSGTQIDKLLASDGAEFDIFGHAIAINAGVVVVGSKGETADHFGAAYVFDGITLGSADQDLGQFTLTPNPASYQVAIRHLALEDKITAVKIHNSLGQLVGHFDQDYFKGTEQWSLDVSNYESGLYFVHLQLGNYIEVKKLLIK